MALQFTGSSSQYISQSSVLGGAYPFSVAMWYNPGSNTGVNAQFTVGSATVASYFAIYNTSGTEEAHLAQAATGGNTAAAAGTLTIGTWYHIAAVYTSATSVTFYLNGVGVTGTASAATPGSLTETVLGAFYDAGVVSDYLTGSIAYPAIWGAYALTSGDVSTLYNSGSGSNPNTLQNSKLVSFLEMQSGSPYLDQVTSSNWTVHGSPTVVADPFSLGATAPTVTVQAAGSITSTSATLNGTVTAQSATSAGFHYGLTTAYGSTVSATGGPFSSTFSASVSGLAPGITYHYQAFGTNSGGTGLSSDDTFTTSSASPTNKGEVLFNGPNQLSSGSTATGSVANLFDADFTTTWTTSSNAAWAGLDCGAATTLTRLRYTGQYNAEDNAIGAVLNGDVSDSTFASPTALATITTRPVFGTLLNEIDVSLSTSYQYYMVQTTASLLWGFADLDFIGNWASGVYSMPVQPVISPPGGNYDKTVVVRMSSITTSASIYYTTDGTAPTTSSNLYTAPITVSANTEINAIAYDAELSTPTSRTTTCFFYVPSILYAHQWQYDDRGYRLVGFMGGYFLDPISGWWYQYPNNDDADHNIYKSADLRNWIFVGTTFSYPAGTKVTGHASSVPGIGGRNQTFYNTVTGNYVTWLTGNTNAQMSVWTAPNPAGPWTLAVNYNSSLEMGDGLNAFSGGKWTGDIGSFIDPATGLAYLVYNWNNNGSTAFVQLDPNNYTNTLSTNKATYTSSRESHCMGYNQGTYFWMNTAEDSWAYSESFYWTASTPIGPWTESLDPFAVVSGSVGPSFDNYNSTPSQFVYIPGRQAYIYVGDDTNISGGTNQFYVTQIICPLTFNTATTMRITWQTGKWVDGSTNFSPWSLDTLFPTVSGAPSPATNLSINSNVATWTNNTTAAYNYLDNSSDNSFATGVVSEVIPVGASSFTITPSVQTGKYFRIRTVNANGTTSTAATSSNQITLVGITKHADKFLKLSNASGALVTQLFPLATLQTGGFETFQQFAQYIGWDTPVDIALTYFNTLP
jgi:hypothetical protein